MTVDLSEFHEWFADCAARHEYRVTRTPIDRLEGWGVDPETGDVAHDSGKFFTVQGLSVTTDARTPGTWAQPIIVQPEIGILGILVRIVEGRVYCLLQAKMEPGNINRLQLSPTVQATRSNYRKVHGGRSVPYLEYFQVERSPGRWVYDALQSEQGSWFLGKRNRNVIVEIDEDVPTHEDFCWIALEELSTLLRVPNLVNMDTRTVLAGLPFLLSEATVNPLFTRLGAGGESRHSLDELLSWFTEAKSRHLLDRRLVPLGQTPEWSTEDGAVVHSSGKYFSVMGVAVQATGREVARWSQPLFEPRGVGVVGFLGRYIGDTFHVLVQAETEAGTHDVAEMAPTVSCIPENYDNDPVLPRPPFLTEMLSAPASSVLLDVVHSEEGGRFYHALNRYMIVDVGEDFDLDVDDDFCWMSLGQLTAFIRYGNHVNVAARCLMSCLAGESATLVPA